MFLRYTLKSCCHLQLFVKVMYFMSKNFIFIENETNDESNTKNFVKLRGYQSLDKKRKKYKRGMAYSMT